MSSVLPAPRAAQLIATTPRGELSEGPRWFGDRLHYVDILGQCLRVMDPVTGVVTSTPYDDTVSFVNPVAGSDDVLIGLGERVVRVGPDGPAHVVASLGDHSVRTNDAGCDPDGVLWVGVMDRAHTAGRGALLTVAAGGVTTLVLDGLTIPNGIAFDRERDRTYVVDSPTRHVFLLARAGAGHRLEPFVTLDPPAVPDGVVLDVDGNLWVAANGGGEARCFSPGGELVATVIAPAAQVSAVALGGPTGQDLFLTTAREGLDDGAQAAQPLAGHVFIASTAGPAGVEVTGWRP